ncbi:hypothetical protein [Helicovermis profundi]|uniref:Uncharacterized protein n=1 Tax=Helicovermis profundi TaxID=3065157 RepID=A0AAU9E9A0_9FIRM|nr:hypothetical protein HLPR_01450 [Clostridia bacterium S502]
MLSIGFIFKNSWEILKKNSFFYLSFSVLALLLGGIYSLFFVGNFNQLYKLYSLLVLHKYIPQTNHSLSVIIITSIAVLMYFILSIMLIQGTVKILDGQTITKDNIKPLFSSSLKVCIPFIIVSLICSLLTTIGLILLIIPGIIISIALFLSTYYVATRDKGIIESLKLSYEKTKGEKMSLIIPFLSISFVLMVPYWIFKFSLTHFNIGLILLSLSIYLFSILYTNICSINLQYFIANKEDKREEINNFVPKELI